MSVRSGEALVSGNDIPNVFTLCRVPAGACSAHAAYGQSSNVALLMDATECAGAWISTFPSELAPAHPEEEIIGPEHRQNVQTQPGAVLHGLLRHRPLQPVLASDGFINIYDLPDVEMRNILCDDEALMQFGFRFLRQVLFGEGSIPLRKEAEAAARRDGTE
jgi:hypothetical protein